MAKTSRRHVSRTVCTMAVAAVLGWPAGMATVLAAPQAADEAAAGHPAQTTPPETGPSPEPSTTDPSSTESDEQDPGPSTSASDEPQHSGDTGDDEQSPAPDEDDAAVEGAIADQQQAVEAVTAELNRVAAEAPKELSSSVARLTGVLQQTQTPRTSPQERESVVETAQDLTSALETISDSRTPGQVREDLIESVKQLVSALDVANDPGAPPEHRAAAVLTVRRTATVLKLIGDRTTSTELRKHLTRSVRQTNAALAMNDDAKTPSGSAPRPSARSAARIGVALATISESETSDGSRNGLADGTDDASSAMRDSSDPTVSEEDRARARKELDRQLRRLEKLLGKEAVARGLPDTSLGKAAELCTNAVFESVSDRVLAGKLRQLNPPPWADKGVKDYWKSEESGNDSLDVHAQLRNNEHDEALFRVARLLTRLAEDVVPAPDLVPTVGTPGLHCLRAARLLDRQGVTAETWLELADAVESKR